MTPDSVVSRSYRLDYTWLEGGVLVYDGTVLRLLAGSGAEIWARMDGVSTAGELAALVGASYSGKAGSVGQDVLEFLEDLARWGVVDVLDPRAEAALTARDAVGYVRDGSLGLLVDFRDGRRRALTSTGARVWELAVSLRHPSQIVQALRQEFSNVPSSLVTDVDEHLDSLVSGGFLVRCERLAPHKADAR